MSTFPPQSPPVRRPQLIDPASTIPLRPGTPEHLARVRAWLLFNANVNAPAAHRLPSYEQLIVSAG
ncbi:hypothetical protein MF672_018465 [Actinomadura sp. ATCC 31491]|uniref:Uncharacterized protein n=1 Tax=Actinomadura luzonensis TaxID=2805427 RepID=A0ABT0FV29_9ACTN|nr:hypothetical protein [Actinomadura luzonensis]MCK2215761.1 hypothetical protein [Actinomadura luzonensis]